MCVSGGLDFFAEQENFAKPFFDVRLIGYQYLSKYLSVLPRVKKADFPEMPTFWILLYKKRQNYHFKGLKYREPLRFYFDGAKEEI